jgi:protein TonB
VKSRQRAAYLISVALHAVLLAAPASVFLRESGEMASLVSIRLLPPEPAARRPNGELLLKPEETERPSAPTPEMAAERPDPPEIPPAPMKESPAAVADRAKPRPALASPQAADTAASETSETDGPPLVAAQLAADVPVARPLPVYPAGPVEGPLAPPVSGAEHWPDAGIGRSAAAAIQTAPPYPPVNRLVLIRERILAARSYPPLARRKGWEGRATVRFRIDAAGRPGSLEVLHSSGVVLLDRASLRAVEGGAPYPPVDGWITVPIVFRLEG